MPCCRLAGRLSTFLSKSDLEFVTLYVPDRDDEEYDQFKIKWLARYKEEMAAKAAARRKRAKAKARGSAGSGSQIQPTKPHA